MSDRPQVEAPDREALPPGEAAAESPRDGELDESRMPFLEHLRELRVRLRNAILAVLVGFVIAFFFKQQLFYLLARPLIELLAELSAENPDLYSVNFVFTSLIEPIWVYFSLSFWAGIFVSSPFVFHQVWKFIAPGLYKNERAYGVGFALTSALLFTAGAAFCYFVALQPTYRFLISYSTENMASMSGAFGADYDLGEAVRLQPLLSMEGYLSFAKKLLLGFGLIFELPLVIFFLALTGAVTHRSLWRFNRYAIVLAFVAAAALTPPDYLSQIIMAGPIVVMYNLSIVVAWVVTRRREKREQAAQL